MDLKVLNNISYGMYVISTKYNDRNVGCFVNTVMQVTSENPIISVTVNKKNYTNEALQVGTEFAVSILSENTDSKVIGKFGFFSSRDTDKFQDITYKEENNIPVVTENICGYLICKVIEKISAETHDIILARVINTQKENDYKPMTYEYYHRVIKGKAHENAPTYQKEEVKKSMGKYRCTVCGHIYDEEAEGVKFEDLPADWVCPLCGVTKDLFEKVEE